MKYLVFLSGPRKGRRVGIDRPVLRIGRDRSNDLSLDDPDTSRNHAEVVLREGVHHIRDLDSTNGTFVNGVRVSEAKLRPGDQIIMGDTILFYEERGTKSVLQAVTFEEGGEEGTRQIRLDPTKSRYFDPVQVMERPGAAERLTQLYRFISDVAPILSPERVLAELMDRVFGSTTADRGFIMLLTDEGRLEAANLRLRNPTSSADVGEIKVSRTMTQRVLASGQSVLSSDTLHDQRFKDSVAFSRSRVSSFACAPLKSQDRILGIIYVDTLGGTEPFTSEDLELVTAMALLAGAQYSNARLYGDLLNSVEYTQSILRCLHSGVVVTGNDGRIQEVNESACGLLGVSRGEVVGHGLEEFRNLRPLWRVIDETLRSGIASERQEFIISVAGEQIPLGMSTSLLRDHENRVRGVVSNFRSLKIIKKLHEQVTKQQHLAALGEMAAGIAHEVRNPLNAIRGFAQLLQEQIAPPEGPAVVEKGGEYLGVIIDEVDRMNRLVQDLLDFSRQQEFTMQTTDVRGVVESVLREMGPELAKAGVETDTSIAPGLPGIMANAAKLMQVLINLIRNAVQAMTPPVAPEGRRRALTVAIAPAVAARPPVEAEGEGLAPAPEQTAAVEIKISDAGVGMDGETLARAFEPFFTARDHGTGLGLAICRKIVRQHGGTIEAESQLGVGSTFRIVLPAG